MSTSSNLITDALKAAGEPTRLRILALLRKGDLAVGELVQILEQSQPRLSHHLKTLTNAGLVERLPEGSWVFYRAARKGWVNHLLEAIFADLDISKEEFEKDRLALNAVRQDRTASANTYFSNIAEKWDQIRAQHYPTADIEGALMEAAGHGPFQRVIDLGTGTGRMLTLFSPFASEVEGLDQSHQMLTVARANLTKSGTNNASVRQGDVTATPFETNCADLVIIHQVLHFVESPETVLAEASRILRPGGKLLVVDFAPHELDFLRGEHGHRRLGIRHKDMLGWAEQTGLALQEPHRFDPPKTLEQGLAVYIWTALQPANQQEAAA